MLRAPLTAVTDIDVVCVAYADQLEHGEVLVRWADAQRLVGGPDHAVRAQLAVAVPHLVVFGADAFVVLRCVNLIRQIAVARFRHRVEGGVRRAVLAGQIERDRAGRTRAVVVLVHSRVVAGAERFRLCHESVRPRRAGCANHIQVKLVSTNAGVSGRVYHMHCIRIRASAQLGCKPASCKRRTTLAVLRQRLSVNVIRRAQAQIGEVIKLHLNLAAIALALRNAARRSISTELTHSVFWEVVFVAIASVVRYVVHIIRQ